MVGWSALILTSVELLFLLFFVKNCSAIMIVGLSAQNVDPDSRWLKPWEFVADSGKEGIGIWVFVEDTMDSMLGTITCAAGL